MDIVERVARAICLADGGMPEALRPWPSKGLEWETCQPAARAALAEVFEWLADPGDDATRRAVQAALLAKLGSDYLWPDYMRDIWATMLAAKRREAGV